MRVSLEAQRRLDGEADMRTDELRSAERTADKPTPQAHGTRRIGSAPSSVLTTQVSLQFPGETTFKDWERAGHQLARMLSSSSWWLGDWLIYGKEHFQDRYEQAAQAAGLQYQTLRNYAWVAGRFEASRRRPAVSFQHHAEVASLDQTEQDRWLSRAQAEGWSLRQLRGAVRAARSGVAKPDPREEGVRRVTVPGERFRRWHEAALQAGTDVEEWMMATLDIAAEQVLAD
jgi:hypothetical protein